MKRISPKKVKLAAKAAKVGVIAAMAVAAQAGVITVPFNESAESPVPV